MATTVRLPEELQREAERYAQTLGLSLNGIIAVSLRDYLDRRLMAPAEQAAPAVERAAPAATVAVPAKPQQSIQPPANRRAPCPCGSGKRYCQCHGAVIAGRPAADG